VHRPSPATLHSLLGAVFDIVQGEITSGRGQMLVQPFVAMLFAPAVSIDPVYVTEGEHGKTVRIETYAYVF